MPKLATPPPPKLAGYRSIPAFGTTATVAVTDAAAAVEAERLLAVELAAIDMACSRFRDDSEISLLARSRGAPTQVSELLFDAMAMACEVALATFGTVDPTVGAAIADLGYDSDFESIAAEDGRPLADPRPAPGWWTIELDPDRRTIAVPDGVRIDLGATGKAFAADRAAERIALATGCGALVNIGGDIAVSGQAPVGGWPIGIAEDSAVAPDQVATVVAISSGGLASSGTTARSWRRGGQLVHHIIDPATGAPTMPYWRLVSATGVSCVAANAASTAALIWGRDAIGNLSVMDVPARLVSLDGSVHFACGWPVGTADPMETIGTSQNGAPR